MSPGLFHSNPNLVILGSKCWAKSLERNTSPAHPAASDSDGSLPGLTDEMGGFGWGLISLMFSSLMCGVETGKLLQKVITGISEVLKKYGHFWFLWDPGKNINRKFSSQCEKRELERFLGNGNLFILVQKYFEMQAYEWSSEVFMKMPILIRIPWSSKIHQHKLTC